MSSLYYQSPEERYGQQFSLFAEQFRSISLEIDSFPNKIKNYFNLPGIDFLISDRDSTALMRTCYLEAFSYGDPGVLLASPGPSLSGLMLRELGTDTQKDKFYLAVKSQKMRTFFALTEPQKGSDANNILTSLVKNENRYFLNGQKSFFGNGAVAETGVVLAKTNDGPLGIRAIWLTPELISNAIIKKNTLEVACLRGAQIAFMEFSDVEIPEDCILGSHRSFCENGLFSIVKVFNQLRTGVGALALGQAQAVYDIVFSIKKSQLRSNKSLFVELSLKLASARKHLHFAAKSVDQNSMSSHYVSVAKVVATRTAENVIFQCLDFCTFEEIIQNPWLLKAERDVYAWEYMEGTSAIQKLQMKKGIELEIFNAKK